MSWSWSNQRAPQVSELHSTPASSAISVKVPSPLLSSSTLPQGSLVMYTSRYPLRSTSATEQVMASTPTLAPLASLTSVKVPSPLLRYKALGM